MRLLVVQSVEAKCVANLVVPAYFLPKLKRLHEIPLVNPTFLGKKRQACLQL